MENKELEKSDNTKKDYNSLYSKLDESITDPHKRNEIVHEIINNTSPDKLTERFLEESAKYLTETPDNKKNKKILTNNRMVTLNKRETSYQGLIDKFENGEDGIYNFMTGDDKNIILVPKIQITEEDIETIPGLKQLREEIKRVEEKYKTANGMQKFLLTKALIEMRQDQYVLKNSYKQPMPVMKLTKSVNQINLDEKITIDENGEPVSDGLVSLFNPSHVCCILCNYSKLKEECWGNFTSDWWYFMEDFDKISEKALKEPYPMLYDIMIYKIDGLQNRTIVEKIKEKYGISYSVEYLSAIWRKKIPKIIADKAKEDWIVWHYTYEERGTWKKCSRCKQIKLAHPYFFSKNKTSKSGYYSLCKECRNKKKDKTL